MVSHSNNLRCSETNFEYCVSYLFLGHLFLDPEAETIEDHYCRSADCRSIRRFSFGLTHNGRFVVTRLQASGSVFRGRRIGILPHILPLPLRCAVRHSRLTSSSSVNRFRNDFNPSNRTSSAEVVPTCDSISEWASRYRGSTLMLGMSQDGTHPS